MKEIKIIWSHEDDPAIPPLICPDTCRMVKEVVKDYQNQCGEDGPVFTYHEDIIAGAKDNENRLTIDGMALEEIVPLPDPSKYCGYACPGCSTQGDGGSTCSRAYEMIPESVLRLALGKVASGYKE